MTRQQRGRYERHVPRNDQHRTRRVNECCVNSGHAANVPEHVALAPHVWQPVARAVVVGDEQEIVDDRHQRSAHAIDDPHTVNELEPLR